MQYWNIDITNKTIKHEKNLKRDSTNLYITYVSYSTAHTRVKLSIF